MSILILGDSFARHGDRDEKDQYYSYQNLLRREYNIEVDCYGYSGHSFFHAYSNLINITDLKKYKLVVFVVTTPDRLYFPKSDIGYASVENAKHVISCYNNEYFFKDHYPSLEETISAAYYYKYLKNYNFDIFVHRSIEQSIKEILNNANINYLFLPVGKDSLSNNPTWTLLDMWYKQTEFYDNLPTNFNFDSYYELPDKILNHLTFENNQALAEYIYDYYTGNKKEFNSSIFKPQENKNFYYYYKPKNHTTDQKNESDKNTQPVSVIEAQNYYQTLKIYYENNFKTKKI